MNSQANPFFVGGAVPPERFIGRQTQVNACFNAMVNMTHLAIYGSPGMGKSSLLRYVVDPQVWKAKGIDPSKVVVAGVNCADIPVYAFRLLAYCPDASKVWLTRRRGVDFGAGSKAHETGGGRQGHRGGVDRYPGGR